MYCPYCGSMIRSYSSVCARCGSDISQVGEDSGEEADLVATYCLKCGRRLSEAGESCPDCDTVDVEEELEGLEQLKAEHSTSGFSTVILILVLCFFGALLFTQIDFSAKSITPEDLNAAQVQLHNSVVKAKPIWDEMWTQSETISNFETTYGREYPDKASKNRVDELTREYKEHFRDIEKALTVLREMKRRGTNVVINPSDRRKLEEMKITDLP